jgi:hypothetical protein
LFCLDDVGFPQEHNVIKRATIHFRLTEAEKAALERLARQDLRNPSAMIRELIRKEAQARGLWPLSTPKGADTN